MSVEKSIEVAEIEGALTTLLTAIDQQRTKVTTIDHQYAHRDRPLTDLHVDDLINDPVGQSCRISVRRLGERLKELDGGRTGLMREVMDRVSNKNDSWADTINSWWNGLGRLESLAKSP